MYLVQVYVVQCNPMLCCVCMCVWVCGILMGCFPFGPSASRPRQGENDHLKKLREKLLNLLKKSGE